MRYEAAQWTYNSELNLDTEEDSAIQANQLRAASYTNDLLVNLIEKHKNKSLFVSNYL